MKKTLLLRDLRIADLTGPNLTAGRWVSGDIRVADGVITQIGPGLSGDGDQVIECEGRFAVPGMIDAHIHLRAAGRIGPTAQVPVPGGDRAADPAATDPAALLSRLHGFLYCGVTSLYDAGNDPAVIFPLREAERDGRIVSPRIFCTGSLLTCPGGHGSQFGITHTGGLADYFAAGPDIVKITYDEHGWGVRPLIPILSRRELRALIDASHQHTRRVTVHVSNELRAREAVAAGADSLAHPVIQSPVTEEFCWLLAAKRIPVVSTLAIGERYPRLADHPEFLDGPLYTACLSAEERAELRGAESARQRENRWADWMRVMTPVAQDNLRRVVAAGGTVVTGTDLSLGADYHRELELLQEAGLAPWDVLRCATVNGATFLGSRALGRTHELGSLMPGYAADLVLLDADPGQDARNLSAIWRVAKGGQLIDRDALDLPGGPGQ